MKTKFFSVARRASPPHFFAMTTRRTRPASRSSKKRSHAARRTADRTGMQSGIGIPDFARGRYSFDSSINLTALFGRSTEFAASSIQHDETPHVAIRGRG